MRDIVRVGFLSCALQKRSVEVRGSGASVVRKLAHRHVFLDHLTACRASSGARCPPAVRASDRMHRVPRVVRVISRLNVGGPAIQALTLTRLLEPLGYETTLVRGVEATREGTMDDMAAELGVNPQLLPSLRRELGPHDAQALLAMTGVLRKVKPDILHTHMAKAGTIGRLAAMLAGDAAPPVRVHTFHGHVLTGYFSARKARIFASIERRLAKGTTRLVAVSDEVRDDLTRLRIAPREQIETIPLGFDLAPFGGTSAETADRRRAVRSELGIAAEARVVTLVARLVPIKRVDRFLRVAGRLTDLEDIRFLIVGDGELRDELQAGDLARSLAPQLTWTGIRRDMPSIVSASDVVALTSDNEGTPVSLIEAQAAGVPVVGTNVGGVAGAVADGQSGILVVPEDEAAFADALRLLLGDPHLAARMGAAGREHVRDRFSIDRLVRDIDGLYRRLLSEAV